VGFSVKLHGLTIGFRVDRPAGLPRLRQLLAASPAQPSEQEEVDLLYSYKVGGRRGRQRDYHLLYQGARPLGRSLHWDELVAPLRLDVASALGLNSQEFISLLGCAVAYQNQGLLILGPLGSGRTTLAETLCQQGAQPIDDPIILLDRSQGLLRSVWSQTPPCPVAAVLVTEFRPAGHFRPRRLAPGPATLELFARAPAATLQPRAVMPGLARLSRQSPLFKGARGEAGEAARRWLELVNR